MVASTSPKIPKMPAPPPRQETAPTPAPTPKPEPQPKQTTTSFTDKASNVHRVSNRLGWTTTTDPEDTIKFLTKEAEKMEENVYKYLESLAKLGNDFCFKKTQNVSNALWVQDVNIEQLTIQLKKVFLNKKKSTKEYMNKKNKLILLSVSLILFGSVFTGCIDNLTFNDGSITYVSHPTRIQYDISYGYWINFTGDGKYQIRYECDIPELLLGTVSSIQILYPYSYNNTILAGNQIVNWDINDEDGKDFRLGVSCAVTSDSLLVSDLNSDDALTIQEIKENHEDIYNQYTKTQSVNKIKYIDPGNPVVNNYASAVLAESESNSSMQIAKELFIWLKNTTSFYRTHILNNSVQPAIKTCNLKTGDCDDLSFLYISMCRSIGIPARFVRGFLVEDSDGVANAVAHAWVEVFVGGDLGNNGWIPVECASASEDLKAQVYQNFAVESTGHLRLFLDDGSNMSMNASISGPKVLYDSGMAVDMNLFVIIDNYNVLSSKELYIDGDGNRKYTE